MDLRLLKLCLQDTLFIDSFFLTYWIAAIVTASDIRTYTKDYFILILHDANQIKRINSEKIIFN